MDTDRQMWQVWARSLHRWGLQDLVASFLEAAGPFTVLGAQAVYLGQPFLREIDRRGHLPALASMLEDHTQTQAFITFLREVNGL